MNKEKKPLFYLFSYTYTGEQGMYYRFIIATGKKEAKTKFIMSINRPLSFYDFKRTNNIPVLFDGEILEQTID